MGNFPRRSAILAAVAIALNIAGIFLLTNRPAAATHFRPAVCVTNLQNWDLCYTTQNGDGLNVYSGYYNDVKVLYDLRIPHVYVDYTGRDDVTDHFSDTLVHSCWRNDYSNRFVVVCDYYFGNYPQCGSYRYQEEFHFNSTGEIWIRLWEFGPGYPYDHTYRGLVRADFDIVNTTNRYFRWDSGWSQKTVEGKYIDDYWNSGGYQSGYEWNVDDPGLARAYFINPNTPDGPSSSEGPYSWGTAQHPTEIEGLNGYADTYLNGESINDSDQVFWYTGFRFNPACTQTSLLSGPEAMVPSTGY